MVPADVNRHDDEVVWRRLFKPTVPSNPHSFRPGDFVRTSKLLGKDKRRGAFRVKSAKGVWLRGVYTVMDRARSLYEGVNYYLLEDSVNYYHLARSESEGSFLRASTAKGERPAQPLARGQKA